MFGIGGIVKWVAIAGIVTAIGVGISKGYEYHLDQIDQAVISSQRQLALAAADRLRKTEDELRAISIADKAIIEKELVVERAKVTDLQRMLLVEHDLDRLLQRKPDSIVRLVNKGTEDYFKKLEETTQ